MNCKNELSETPPVSRVPGLFEGDSYHTADQQISGLSKLLFWNAPSYYWQFVMVVRRGASLAKKNMYTRQEWFNLSNDILDFTERNGGVFDVSGMDNFHSVEGPVIFVGNHMSVLETVILPGLILKYKELCITLKKQLFDVPFFGTLCTGFRSISVSRQDPIEDYKKIMREGAQAVKDGYSTLIFPQTTRTTNFEPENFNSAGVKLAKRVGVPVIPIALKTDFWGNGKYVKDFGCIDRSKTIHFRFGEPITVEGKGKEENAQIIDFISSTLAEWQQEDAAAK